MTVYLSLSEACLSARARKGHTQAEAACAVGRSVRTWKAWEHGEASPIARHLVALAGYLGVRIPDLVRLVQHDAEGSSAPLEPQAPWGQP